MPAGRSQTFKQFLTATSAQINVMEFVVNLVLAAVLAFVLSRIYARFGTSLSNRKAFARNFILITMTTMLIITIVKSSLALSLGLVGALSIVRFRTAIKEPEELAYMFLAISIGLGLGANQRIITLVATAGIIAVIIIRSRFVRRQENQNLHLTVSSGNPGKFDLKQVVETLQAHCLAVSLKRFTENDKILEASFLVEFADFNQLNETKVALQELNGALNISFLDYQGLT